MKRLVIAILLALVVPACHNGVRPDIVVVPPAPSAPMTHVVLQATNRDYRDYDLWMEWQDREAGVYTYLFSVWGDPWIGPTMNYVTILADPSITYTVILRDFWGTFYDSYTLTIPVASSVDVSFDIVDGFLVRTFP